MWGRLNQLAQTVQGSFSEDEGGAVGTPSKEGHQAVERLKLQLEEAEERNRQINTEFKKLLKEKQVKLSHDRSVKLDHHSSSLV